MPLRPRHKNEDHHMGSCGSRRTLLLYFYLHNNKFSLVTVSIKRWLGDTNTPSTESTGLLPMWFCIVHWKHWCSHDVLLVAIYNDDTTVQIRIRLHCKQAANMHNLTLTEKSKATNKPRLVTSYTIIMIIVLLRYLKLQPKPRFLKKLSITDT